MIRAIAVKAAAHWTGEPADRVMLDYDNRRRRRMTMRGAKGTAFLLDLPTSATLHNGDALVLEDGRLVEVLSAPEPLLEICCSDPEHLARVAWHLGNRHLPTQLLPASLRIRRDHVIAEMAVGLGAQVIDIEAPFEPEGGAYAVAPGHHHRHESEQHDHSHSHGNGHDHGR